MAYLANVVQDSIHIPAISKDSFLARTLKAPCSPKGAQHENAESKWRHRSSQVNVSGLQCEEKTFFFFCSVRSQFLHDQRRTIPRINFKYFGVWLLKKTNYIPNPPIDFPLQKCDERHHHLWRYWQSDKHRLQWAVTGLFVSVWWEFLYPSVWWELKDFISGRFILTGFISRNATVNHTWQSQHLPNKGRRQHLPRQASIQRGCTPCGLIQRNQPIVLGHFSSCLDWPRSRCGQGPPGNIKHPGKVEQGKPHSQKQEHPCRQGRARQTTLPETTTPMQGWARQTTLQWSNLNIWTYSLVFPRPHVKRAFQLRCIHFTHTDDLPIVRHMFVLGWTYPCQWICLFTVHSKKTDPWGEFEIFQMLWKIVQFSLFQCLEDASFYHFNFKYVPPWESNFPFFARKSVVLDFHPQVSVRCRCASYMYQFHLRRAKASRRWLCTATALVRCREDDSKKIRDVLV